MQLNPIDSSASVPPTEASESPDPNTQDGIDPSAPSSLDGRSQPRSRRLSRGSVAADASLSARGVIADELDKTMLRLSLHEGHTPVPGERVSAYENAATPTGHQAMGFKVVKRSGSPSNGPRLTDCPNEILTHVMSHLHPDSHGAVALVSKRFYALITEPHAWRMAFLRYFPGQDNLGNSNRKTLEDGGDGQDDNIVRSEFRYFTRLTSLASWRSEYLLRTRLLRSVARGKPGTSLGGTGSSSRSHSNKKASAVLTYNSKLPWMVSNVHAVFDNTRKGPKAIVGTADLCVSTVSDPSNGKVEKWGLDDPFSFAQLDEVFPNLIPFGLGDGPAAVYNIMDVSQLHGMIGGEGFPGGRPFYRAINEVRGRYLGDLSSAIIDMTPEVPKIPELTESICSLWIAKTSAVPTVTQNMVGMMVGSSLGVVTTYALGHDASGPRYKAGEMTARWVLSPGVPIISLKVDESYSYKRRTLGRMWACAVNALGEVFILTATPTAPAESVRKELGSTKTAWLAGRSVYWDLIESTRRHARPDELDKNAVRGAYSPRSPCDTMHLSKEQLVAEAREIEKFLRYEPAHFRKVCEGWDMRRKVEVDFGEEIILVIRCLQDQDSPAEILRHTRINVCDNSRTDAGVASDAESTVPTQSIFGPGNHTSATSESSSPTPASAIDVPTTITSSGGDWRTSILSLKKLGKADITSSAMDNSLCALLAPFEDPLNGEQQTQKIGTVIPTFKQSNGEIPGRRARLFGVGTDHGKVIVWNMRDSSVDLVEPMFVIQTESPDITSLAMSALYLVCGGSDGLVQAWDPLASTLEPIRTLNSKSSGRAPRHIVNANPVLRQADYSTCSAIFLDPDATSLRGLLCFGTFVRYWTYSSAAQTVGRKRRLRHSDVHGRLASRRQGNTMGYIAAEEAELRKEREHRAREDARLRNRFGVDLGLTEEESIRYAQMISEEAFLRDEQRRTSASDTGSTADIGENMSNSGSLDTVTPDPSQSGGSAIPSTSPPVVNTTFAEDDDFELQIQRALRLSLMEGVNDMGQSPPVNSSTDFDFQVKYKSPKNKRSAPASLITSQTHTPFPQHGQSSGQSFQVSASTSFGEDEDLALALSLSLQDEEQQTRVEDVGLGIVDEGFPSLEGSGKGKGVSRL
ncbi:hypothetical protein N0V93_007332 [Gnomoniopsis smithogilvyi]|uniref:F-box domain-containing protein n=1 Tax=Gnomoniopsis smithogilvyi TaxID=1191159 RepID=A0A9W8YQ95_9PEZI|nr:hypothetical protein N0V93_007332 [Gnomoniopsis smithogilvyi]